jgi:hypothetical protein
MGTGQLLLAANSGPAQLATAVSGYINAALGYASTFGTHVAGYAGVAASTIANIPATAATLATSTTGIGSITAAATTHQMIGATTVGMAGAGLLAAAKHLSAEPDTAPAT